MQLPFILLPHMDSYRFDVERLTFPTERQHQAGGDNGGGDENREGEVDMSQWRRTFSPSAEGLTSPERECAIEPAENSAER